MSSLSKKKILFLTAWYPSSQDPMLGLFVLRHAEITSHRFTTAVLYTQTTSGSKKYELTVTNENNLLTVRVFYPKVTCTIPGISQYIKIWRLFNAHLIGFRIIRKQVGIPDLVHLNILTRVGIFALFLKIRYKIPYVITEHWSRYLSGRDEFNGLWRTMATKIIVRFSNGISTVSQRLRSDMIACGISHKKFLLVHNVVDTDLFQPLHVPLIETPRIFSHISCFDNKAKNTNGIVLAIAELTKTRSDFTCLMVGDGPDRIEAEHLAGTLGIKDKTIRFTGLLEGKELVDIYDKSLFTLLFSNYENMPVVISESFACGKPVISTRVGGIPEVVNDTNGILISPGNIAELTDSISYMLDHATQFDTTLIRGTAITLFGKESVMDQLLQLYGLVL